MAQKGRKLVKPAGQLVVDDDDPPIVFNFDDDSDDSNPHTAQNGSSRQVQVRPAAQAAPAAAQPAAADQYLQNIQQVKAMIEALEAKKARSGAVIRQRRKPAKAAPTMKGDQQNGMVPLASAAQVPANSTATVPPAAKAAPLTQEQLMEDMEYILGENQVPDEEELQLLQLQVDSDLETEAATAKTQAAAVVSGGTAGAGAAAVTAGKPHAVRKGAGRSSTEPPAAGVASRGQSPATRMVAVLNSAMETAAAAGGGTSASASKQAGKAAAVPAAAVVALSKPAGTATSTTQSTLALAPPAAPLSNAEMTNETLRSRVAAAGASAAVHAVRPAVKQSPKTAAVAVQSPPQQRQQSTGITGVPTAIDVKSKLGLSAGLASAVGIKAAVRAIKPKTPSKRGLPQQKQQSQSPQQQQVQGQVSQQQQQQHQQVPQQSQQQQQQQQEEPVGLQTLDDSVLQPHDHHAADHQQAQQSTAVAPVPQFEQQRIVQPHPPQSPLLALLLSPGIPPGFDHLQQHQQQQALQLLAQQQRCLIQERILQQEVQQLQQSWQQVNQQLAVLLGPQAQIAAAAVQTAGTWLALTGGQTTAVGSFLSARATPVAAEANEHVRAPATGALGVKQLLAAQVARPTSAPDVDDLVRQRALQLQQKRQQYKQQLEQLHEECDIRAGDAGDPAMQQQQQQEQQGLQLLALEPPAVLTLEPPAVPAVLQQQAPPEAGAAAVGGSKKRPAADEPVGGDGGPAKRLRLAPSAAAANTGEGLQLPPGTDVEAGHPAALAPAAAGVAGAGADDLNTEPTSRPASRSRSRDRSATGHKQTGIKGLSRGDKRGVRKSTPHSRSSRSSDRSSRSSSRGGERSSRYRRVADHREKRWRGRSSSRDRRRAASRDRSKGRGRKSRRTSHSRERSRDHKKGRGRHVGQYSSRQAADVSRPRSRSPLQPSRLWRNSNRGEAEQGRGRWGSSRPERSASREGRHRSRERTAAATITTAAAAATAEEQPKQQKEQQQDLEQLSSRQQKQQMQQQQQVPGEHQQHQQPQVQQQQGQQQAQGKLQQQQTRQAPAKYVIPSRRQQPPSGVTPAHGAPQTTAAAAAGGNAAVRPSAPSVLAHVSAQATADKVALQPVVAHFSGLDARRQRQQQRQQQSQQHPNGCGATAEAQDVDMETDEGTSAAAAVAAKDAASHLDQQPPHAAHSVAVAVPFEQQAQQKAQIWLEQQQQQWDRITQMGWSTKPAGLGKGFRISTWPLLSSAVLLHLGRQIQTQLAQGSDARAMPTTQESISNATARITTALGIQVSSSRSSSTTAHKAAASSKVVNLCGKYNSSLLCFRSYRLAPQFAGITGGLDPGSSTLCNAIDPHWPLCRHESRGVHRDDSCAWQHWSDMALTVSEVERQWQRLLAAAGVPDAVAIASQWKAHQIQQQPTAASQQQGNEGTKRLHQVIAAAEVDWFKMLQGQGLSATAGAVPAKKARAVDAAVKAAAVDAAVSAASSVQLCAGLTQAPIAAAAPVDSQNQLVRGISQQNAVLAAAGISIGPPFSTQKQKLQTGELYSWCGQLFTYGQPLEGLDLYNLPTAAQQEAQLAAQQQQQLDAWMKQQGAREKQQEQRQPVKQRGWRYFDGQLPKFGAGTSATAAPEKATAHAAAGEAVDACAASTPTDTDTARAAAGQTDMLKAALARVDAEYEAKQQQLAPAPAFWLSWALATLDVLSTPPHEVAAAQQQTLQQQQQLPPSKKQENFILNKVGGILLKGLALQPAAPELWLLHGQLLLRRAGFGKMQMTILQRAESFCESSYDLWLLAAHVQPTWQQQLVVWLKALAYVSAAAAPSNGGADRQPAAASSSGGAAGDGRQQQQQGVGLNSDGDMLADCVVDIALRLIRCLCGAGADNLFCIWCNKLLHAAQQQQQHSVLNKVASTSAVKAAAEEVNATLQKLVTELANTSQVSVTAGGKHPTAAATEQEPTVAAATAVAHDVLTAAVLSGLAVESMLAVLQHYPVQLATFWLSLCHAAACGELPTAVESRLQYQQHQQDCGFVLDFVEFAAQSAAAQGPRYQGLQMGGRLLLAAVGGQVPGLGPHAKPAAHGPTASTGQQQQDELLSGSSTAQRCIIHSYWALRPFWHLMGLPPYDITAPGTATMQTPQQQQQQQGQLSRLQAKSAITDEYSAAAAGSAARSSADTTAASVLQCLKECQLAMQSQQAPPAAADEVPLKNTCSSDSLNDVIAWGLTQPKLQQQEIWMAQVAAATQAPAQQQQEQQVAALLRGVMASGLGHSVVQQLDMRATSNAAGSAIGAAADVAVLAADPCRVRGAFQQLLGLPPTDCSVASLQQQQQLDQSSGVSAAVHQGQAPTASVTVQRCLAYINWAGFEVTLGDYDGAAQCLLQGLTETSRWQQPVLTTLMHTQMLALLASAASASSSGSGSDAVATAGDAANDALVSCLRAVLSVPQLDSSSSSGSGVVLLHHPSMRYSSPELSRRLEPDVLHCCHPVLEAGLEGVLSGLNRQQVVLLIEHIIDLCPPHPRLLQLLLHTAQQHNTDQGWCAWLAPLTVSTCYNSRPPAPAGMWAAVVDLVRGVSVAAAAEVARQAVVAHPWSKNMWQLHCDTAGSAEAQAAIRGLAVKHGFSLLPCRGSQQ